MRVHTYTYNGILLSHKKNGISPFVTTWMSLEGIMLSGISQTEKVKYHMILLICGIEKKPTNEQNKTETVIDTENKCLPEGRGDGGGEK